MAAITTRAGKGSPLTNAELDANFTNINAELAAAAAPTTLQVSQFSGTGAQTAFTLPTAPTGENNTQVYISGVYQQKSEYTVAGTTLTFSEAPPAGTNNIEVVTVAVRDIGTADAAFTSYLPAGTGAVARTVQAKLRDVVSVKDFGAVGDGVTDDTSAVAAAWAHVRDVATFKRLHFPAGTYNLASLATSLEPTSGMVVTGDGMDATSVRFNSTTGLDLFFRNSGLARLSNIEFRDFHVHGGHGNGGDYTQVGSYPFLISNVDTITLSRVKVTYSRTMAMALRGCTNVAVQGCVIQYCARDGINTADCSQVAITGNRIEFVDDDAIAGHTQIYGTVDRGYVVSDNVIRFAQGIRLMGIQTASITGNVIEFCMSQGISVAGMSASGGQLEGVSAHSGITISGNTIKNMIDRAVVDALNSTAPYIVIGGEAQQAGGLAGIPGEAAGGSIVPLYDYFDNSSGGTSTSPIPANYHVTISGNILVRDIPTSGLLSALGYGMFYTRNGFVDATLSDSAVRENGVQFAGGITRKVLVANNQLAGIAYGIYLLSSATHVLDALVQGNTFFDCTGVFAGSGANTKTHRIYFLHNIVDLDPLLVHANRGANGTYLANGHPTAFLLQSSKGLTLGGNVFRNIGRVSEASVTTMTTLQGSAIGLLGENYIECDPAVWGFSTSNKGIGDVPRGPGWVLVVVDSDPASATYGNVLNFCPTAGNAMPSAGKFVPGHVVRNCAPSVAGGAGSQYVVLGWVRITNGSGHVLNTDWRELRTLTGT